MLNRKKLQKHHKRRTVLRDIILGGQDGLVNVMGLSLGLFAAHAVSGLILIAGLSAGFAEFISMGAVAYTSSLAERDFYIKTKREALKDIENIPLVERDDIEHIYRVKGFKGDVLETIVNQVCSDKELWVDTILAEDVKVAKV